MKVFLELITVNDKFDKKKTILYTYQNIRKNDIIISDFLLS